MLGLVIAFALTSGIAAHAAQAPERPFVPVTLTSGHTALPVALQTAASHVAETATGTIDPAAAIRAAYQRDHVALEHLRQEASPLGQARPGFNQYLSDREGALAEVERTALATSRPAVASTIAAMDALVTAAQTKLDVALAQLATAKSASNQQGKPSASTGQAQSGQSGQSGQSAQSKGGNH
jgi:hypothetical protein